MPRHPKNEIVSRTKQSLEAQSGIKTPQQLIHIRHNITLVQYKLWLLLTRTFMDQIRAEIPADENGFRELNFKTFEDFFEYKPKKIELDSDMRRLKNSDLSMNILEKDGKTALYGSGFILEWKIYEGALKFKLPSIVEQAIRELDHSGSIWQVINWQIFNSFSSKYAAILYKLCKDYMKVGKTPKFTVEKFREYMGLRNDEYAEFKTLSRDVISKPIKQINEGIQGTASDIEIEVEYFREKKSVVALQFHIAQRAQPMLPFPEFATTWCFKESRSIIGPALQVEYLQLRSEEEIALCIQKANEYGDKLSKSGKTVKDYGALYRSAITEGWHTQILEQAKMEEAEKKLKAQKARDLKKIKEAEKLKTSAIAQEIEMELANFEKLPEEEKNLLRSEYERSIANSPMKKYFVEKQEKSPAHRGLFVKFLKSKK